VDGSNDFLLARLEEGILDVGKGNIDDIILDSVISKAVEMTLQVTFGLFLSNSRSSIKVSQDRPLTFIDVYSFLFNNIFLGMLLTHLEPYFLLQDLHLFLKLSYSADLLTSEHQFFDVNSRLSVFGEVDGCYSVGQMEVESQRGILSFVVLYHTFQYTNVEGNMLTVDWKQYRVVFVIDVNKPWLQIFW